jgi:hypothetical protein
LPSYCQNVPQLPAGVQQQLLLAPVLLLLLQWRSELAEPLAAAV